MTSSSSTHWKSGISGRPALVATVAGLLYALILFDLDFLLGRGPYWEQPFGDTITHLIGATYFVRDHWRFPLFFVPHLGFPEGTNIVFTDSLPLVALGAKVVYAATGWSANYFGLWLLACFPLLGYFTAKTVREFGVTSNFAALGAALLAVMSPALLARFGHHALMGHFLIAWSFYLYARMRTGPGRNAEIVQFSLLASGALLIQAYFLPIVLAFLASAMLQAVVEQRCTLARATLSVGLASGTAILFAWAAGIIGPGSMSVPMVGFGFYSMNILSPFLPPREHLPELLSQLVNWDGRGFTWDATGGQYEGYNYLGAGLLTLLVLHLLVSRRLFAGVLKRHVVLSCILIGLVLYALSNRIYLGDHLILEYPLPEAISKLTSQFRTGGRYFWPIYYVLVVGVVVATFQRFDRRVATLIVLIAAGIQAADTEVQRRGLVARASSGYPQVLDTKTWAYVIQAHKFIEQYPSFQCGGWSGRWPDNNANMEFHSIAAKLEKPINTVYVARLVKDCRTEAEQGLTFDIRPGGLYVFGRDFPISKIVTAPGFGELCRAFKWGFACTREWSSLEDRVLLPHFRPILSGEVLSGQGIGEIPLQPIKNLPRYTTGDLLRFGAGGNGNRYLGWGWFNPEGWGTWSRGSGSDISVQLEEPVAELLQLSVHAWAFVHPERTVAEVDVYANGHSIARWEFRSGEGFTEKSAIVPRRTIGQGGTLRLQFVPTSAQSPKEAGLSDDERQLGIGLVDLRLVPRMAAQE